MIFHNPDLASLVPDGDYHTEDLSRLEAAFDDHHTLTFVRLPSGLFSASSAGASIASSGYANGTVVAGLEALLALIRAARTILEMNKTQEDVRTAVERYTNEHNFESDVLLAKLERKHQAPGAG